MCMCGESMVRNSESKFKSDSEQHDMMGMHAALNLRLPYSLDQVERTGDSCFRRGFSLLSATGGFVR